MVHMKAALASAEREQAKNLVLPAQVLRIQVVRRAALGVFLRTLRVRECCARRRPIGAI